MGRRLPRALSLTPAWGCPKCLACWAVSGRTPRTAFTSGPDAARTLCGSSRQVIVLGNDGNVAEYVFDKRDGRFHTINMGFPDEKFATFDTFEDMLSAVLEERRFVHGRPE